jgi:hypothetical protein
MRKTLLALGLVATLLTGCGVINNSVTYNQLYYIDSNKDGKYDSLIVERHVRCKSESTTADTVVSRYKTYVNGNFTQDEIKSRLFSKENPIFITR